MCMHYMCIYIYIYTHTYYTHVLLLLLLIIIIIIMISIIIIMINIIIMMTIMNRMLQASPDPATMHAVVGVVAARRHLGTPGYQYTIIISVICCITHVYDVSCY